MSLSTKFGVLLLAAGGAWALTEFDLVSRAPQESAGVALAQLQSEPDAADRLRLAEAAKNGWLALWPLLIVTLAGLLFWDDIVKWCHSQRRGASAASPADQDIQGDKS